MARPPRLLILSSHVGLGHVTRDLAVVRALRRKMRVDVEWCTASPAVEYLEANGERIAPGCRGLWSLSELIEDLYNGGLRRLREAASKLKMLKRNWDIVAEIIEDYDLVLADEFWELVYAAPASTRERAIFATDLIYMPYKLNPIEALISYAVNRFFREKLASFKTLVYLNELDLVENHRWVPLVGERVGDWVKRNARILGLATSYLEDELPEPREARRRLGIDDSQPLVTVTVGGTDTRSRQLLDCIARSLKTLKQVVKTMLGSEPLVVFVTGPRTNWLPGRLGEEGGIRVIRFTPSMRDLYAASTLFISRAGRTTTADLLCASKPAILVPIRGHIEQEHIARHMARKYGYPVIPEARCNPARLAKAVRKTLSLKPLRPKSCGGTERLAAMLEAILEASQTFNASLQPLHQPTYAGS